MQQLPAVSGVRTNYITGSLFLRIFRPICVLGLMFLLWALFATSSQEHWPDFGEPGTRSPPELLWAMELVVFTGCALHDAQIAFKRPLLEWMGDADCVRNVHVAVESIRNSMDLIIRHLGLWITRSLRFGPPLTDDRQTWEKEDEEEIALDEIEIEAAFAELEEKRAEDDLMGLAAEDDFKVGLLGGAASQRDRGDRVQSISCWLGTWRL
jgi:hypothetical protein